jgi:hypothetical protein
VHPQTIEWIAQTAHNIIRPGCCVAFANKKSETENGKIYGDGDEVVLVAELRHSLSSPEEQEVKAVVSLVGQLSQYENDDINYYY